MNEQRGIGKAICKLAKNKNLLLETYVFVYVFQRVNFIEISTKFFEYGALY